MPDWKDEIRKHLAVLQLNPTREVEIVEELNDDLEDRYQRLLVDGVSPEKARLSVLKQLSESDVWRRELQNVERVYHPRDALMGSPSGANVLSDLWQDLRYALRTLIKNPGFTVVAVVALALGIGANTAIFSVVNSVLLRPLPYKDPDQLMMVWEDNSKSGYPRDTPTVANFIDWRDQNRTFVGMAAMAYQSFNLTGVGDPERIDGRRVSSSLFPLLRVDAQLGRTFMPEEDQRGAAHFVILSHAVWQRRFGGDPHIIGKSLTLNNESYSVVGVMPPRFQFPSRYDELWVPIAFDSNQAGDRSSHYLKVLGRLKPGVTLAQAQADLTAIATRLQQQYPKTNTDLGAVVTPLHEQLVGDIKPFLLILLGAVGLVLLIACANVANLLLARAAVRQKEIAVRVALGASKWRLIRQFLTESILLCVIAAVVGLILAVGGLFLLKAFIPPEISIAREVWVDTRVLGFTFGISMLTALIFGLAPATQAAKFNLNETLKERGRDSSSGRRRNRVRAILVVAEVAVSLVLLIGAGLLINSFIRLRTTDPGFNTDNMLTMSIDLPDPKYTEFKRRSAFYDDLIQRVQSLPGVKSAAVTTNLPLLKQGNEISIAIEGRPALPPGQEIIITTRMVSPNYFETMGMRLLKGRGLSDQDRKNTPGVVVISEGMAKRYWPDQDPIGKRIAAGDPEKPEDWLQIVGVVNDVRQYQLDAQPKPQMYLTYAQVGFFAPRDLVVKTDVDPASLAATVRRAVWEIDKDQPVSDISTMHVILNESITKQRFSMLLFAIFAALAMLLAAVGIYGVMSYSVAQRRSEIGIRMALGAQKFDVLKLTVGEGLKLVLIGIGLGLIGAFLLTRLMSSLLFGITATDPLTFAAISLVLVCVALIASYVPAIRATKVDPLVALRYE